MRFAIALLVVATLDPARAHAVPVTNAVAVAWQTNDSHSGSADVSSAATSSGPGAGSASSSAGTALGFLQGWATMTGCSMQLPLFQQPCNESDAQSSFTDVVHVVSDAPAGTPVQVQATYSASGLITGTGTYGYDSSALVGSTGLMGVSGGSGGLTVMQANIPLLGSTTSSIAATVGAGIPIESHNNLGVGDRFCDGGSQNCAISETSWSMTLSITGSLTLTVPSLPAGATYVHLVGDSGHDYSIVTTAVPDGLPALDGLAAARPNPARGRTVLDLTLTAARPVDVGVFDVAGRRVATLVRGRLEPGVHALAWDGRDASGARVRGGVYFVRARGEGFTSTRRVLELD